MKTTKTTATAKVDTAANHHDFYKAAYLAAWVADLSGPAPTLAMFDAAHALSPKRPGVEALHIAMCLRAKGCTVAEFCAAGSCGPANNYRRHLVNTVKVIKVEVLPRDGSRAYAYKATLTAKGVKALEAAGVKVPASAVPAAKVGPTEAQQVARDTAKAARKRKAKATPAPVTEPAPQVEPAPQA